MKWLIQLARKESFVAFLLWFAQMVITGGLLILILPKTFGPMSGFLGVFAGGYFTLPILFGHVTQGQRRVYRYIAYQHLGLALATPWLGWDFDTVKDWIASFILVISVIMPISYMLMEEWHSRRLK